MKKILMAASILTAFHGLASAQESTGRGTTAVIGNSVVAGISNPNLSSARASDCVDCHTEIFPFKKPETCERSFFPFSSSEKDCWKKEELNDDTDILTRENGQIRTLYRFEMPWRGFRYLLPAEKGTRNPHYVLEELK